MDKTMAMGLIALGVLLIFGVFIIIAFSDVDHITGYLNHHSDGIRIPGTFGGEPVGK